MSVCLTTSGLQMPYVAPPGAPLNLTATGGSNQVALSWNAPTGSGSPLGLNLVGLSYFSTELPFLNIMKSGGASSGAGANVAYNWITQTAGGTDSQEEYKVALDGNGYPTQWPQAGLTATKTVFIMNLGLGLPAGAILPYGSGTPTNYTLQFQGAGAIVLAGDVVSGSLATSSPNVSVAGLTITSTQSAGHTASITFNVNPTSGGGIFVTLTSSTAGNYLQGMSCVETARLSLFQAGEIFHPTFLAKMAGITCLRAMGWADGFQQLIRCTFSVNPTGTSGTVTTFSWSGQTSSFWQGSTGTYRMVFSDGEERDVTLTQGASSASWTGALGAQTAADGIIPVTSGWAQRPVVSQAFYGGSDVRGCPLEIILALANKLKCDIWLAMPPTYSDADMVSYGALVSSTLNPAQKAYIELSNEVWNGTYIEEQYAQYKGKGLTSGLASDFEYNRYWHGVRTGQMATNLQTAFGSGFSRCYPVLAGQAANTYVITDAMSYIAGSPPIKTFAIAPYFPADAYSTMSTADANTIKAQSDGGVSYLLQCMASNVMVGGSSPGTLASVPSGGYLPQALSYIDAHVAIMPNYPAVTLAGYEGGQQGEGGFPPGSPLGTLIASINRTAQMGSYFTTFLNYWGAKVGKGNTNVLCVTDSASNYGTQAYGLLESVQQTTSPLSSAPAKWQAFQNYLGTSAIAFYTIYRQDSFGSWPHIQQVIGTTYTDTGLSLATNYSYRVVATAVNGAVSVPSNQATGLTLGPIPGVPGTLSVASTTQTSVSLSWGAASNATSYTLHRNGAVIQSGITVTSAVDTGLTASTAYIYFVTAVNANGESASSNTVTGTTQPASSGLSAFGTAQLAAFGHYVQYNNYDATTSSAQWNMMSSTLAADVADPNIRGMLFYYKWSEFEASKRVYTAGDNFITTLFAKIAAAETAAGRPANSFKVIFIGTMCHLTKGLGGLSKWPSGWTGGTVGSTTAGVNYMVLDTPTDAATQTQITMNAACITEMQAHHQHFAALQVDGRNLDGHPRLAAWGLDDETSLLSSGFSSFFPSVPEVPLLQMYKNQLGAFQNTAALVRVNWFSSDQHGTDFINGIFNDPNGWRCWFGGPDPMHRNTTMQRMWRGELTAPTNHVGDQRGARIWASMNQGAFWGEKNQRSNNYALVPPGAIAAGEFGQNAYDRIGPSTSNNLIVKPEDWWAGFNRSGDITPDNVHNYDNTSWIPSGYAIPSGAAAGTYQTNMHGYVYIWNRDDAGPVNPNFVLQFSTRRFQRPIEFLADGVTIDTSKSSPYVHGMPTTAVQCAKDVIDGMSGTTNTDTPTTLK